MSLPYKSELIARAKDLRKQATPQENHLWYDYLSDYPVRFQRQKTIGGYIVDFYCHAAKLVIEVDGIQHTSDEAKAYDSKRTRFLEGLGLSVLRFSNDEILETFSSACETINRTVQEKIGEVDAGY
ncbi:MAG: DUF559 domain-containing protein [Clostridia bacterium]|nr:DUF559 domain-containing protein [Clostridia bacterium]